MKISRRMFLQASSGAAALAVPTLWSFLFKASRAQEAALSVRYV